MEKEKLPPIPTPVSQRWREFRIQVLPFVVFLGIIAGIFYLWKTYVQPVGVIGAAETNLVNVTSLQDGLIQQLFVERFESVTQGQAIAVIVNTDPDLIKAQIESVQADIKVLEARNRVDVERGFQAFQQFRQDLLKLHVDQAKDGVEWQLSSNELYRAEVGFKDGVVTAAALDSAKAKRDAYAAAIEERGRQILDLEKSLADLAERQKPGGPDAFADATEKKAKELELTLKPSVLKAPISGMVSMVHHLQNERVLRGMPIVSVSDPNTGRIVAYVRQPVTVLPTTNDFAVITTRSQPRQTGRGQILHVGAQMEIINPAMISPESKRMEVGLPIVVSLPTNIRLVPGEFVDLQIQYPRR
jgi:multidrug resistance efflux pump